MKVIAKTDTDIYLVEVSASELRGLDAQKALGQGNFINATVDLNTLLNRVTAAENASSNIQQLRNKVQRTLNVLDDVLE